MARPLRVEFEEAIYHLCGRGNARQAIFHDERKIRTGEVSICRVPERFPPELHAPMTADVERQLKQLVAEFGEKKVREALDPLVTKCKWNDWQCVANAIRRIARQK
jgi:hypothetical protein